MTCPKNPFSWKPNPTASCNKLQSLLYWIVNTSAVPFSYLRQCSGAEYIFFVVTLNIFISSTRGSKPYVKPNPLRSKLSSTKISPPPRASYNRTSAYRLSEMTTNPGTEKQPPTPVTDSSMSSKSIEVQPLPDEAPAETIPVAPSEGGSDAPRKHKRRSGNSVDLTYRYDEPSDDELSWTEDEHGTRRRRKSKKTRGGGDDFKTGIMFVRVKSEF